MAKFVSNVVKILLSISEVYNQAIFYIIAITSMSIVIFQEEASGKFTRRSVVDKEVYVAQC